MAIKTESNFEIIAGESCELYISNIEQELKEAFARLDKEHINKESADYFYIWDIGYPCFRAKYYNVLLKQEVDWELKKRLLMGKATHNIIETGLEEVGYTTEYVLKQSFKERGFMISSKPDAVLIKNGKIVKVVELKSAEFFKYITKPYAVNLPQLQLYIYMLGLKDGTLLYINPTNGQMKEYTVQLNMTIVLDCLEKLELISHCIKTNQLPFKTKTARCKHCLYRTECKENKLIIKESI